MFKEFYNKHQGIINIGVAFAGFTFDLFFTKRPDSIADNILLLMYLCIVAVVIIGIVRHKATMQEESPLHIFVLQFCFGGLASNLLILYGKSGTFAGSMLFVGFLVVFALGNEFLKSRYEQLRFNIAVYYFLLLTYCIIAIPTFIFHSIGWKVFLASGAVSLVFIWLFLLILSILKAKPLGEKSMESKLLYFPSDAESKHQYRVSEVDVRGKVGQVDPRTFRREVSLKELRDIAMVVLGIFVTFNALYFTNLIPPVPLALKSIGVYHSIVRTTHGDYTATLEPNEWFIFWRDTSAKFIVADTDPAYCFSAVFAPTGLTTPIIHVWEYFYPETGHWAPMAKIQFPINGGRSEGYRGFSMKSKLQNGKWRCNVETTEGQLIGRITFNVIHAPTAPTLSTKTL